MSSHLVSPRGSPLRPAMKRRQPPYRAARAFYLTLFILTCLAILAALSARPDAHSTPLTLHRRTLDDDDDDDRLFPQASDEEECRLVHRARDQCAFIQSHCPLDEEAGFAAYLDLYFCRLHHVKPLAFTILIAWLGVLFSTIGIAASDFFCINLNSIAGILGMSESMAGVTFLAFGNGSPDVFSTFAAMSTNSGNLAVGELFGAAGFITAVVAGSMALIRPFKVSRKSFVRDVGFFVVAAAFSMVFLWDGRLHFWECLTMVAFYVFYVLFVIVWHWWIGRRREKREKEAAARGHFVNPGEETEFEQYHDDPDEDVGSARPSVSRGTSREDWSALERGAAFTDGTDDGDDDTEEEARDRWMSDLATNMRLTRPKVGPRSRKNTLSTVRPSLVGALEFQAVIKSLQKSRNIQTIPMSARRYSDDPSFTTAQLQDHLSTVSDPAARPPFQVTIDGGGSPTVERPNGLDVPKPAPAARGRAISANGAQDLIVDADLRRESRTPTPPVLGDGHGRSRSPSLQVPGQDSQNPSPMLHISAASPSPQSPLRLDTSVQTQSAGHLAPPSGGVLRNPSDHFTPRSEALASPADSPRTGALRLPSARSLPRILANFFTFPLTAPTVQRRCIAVGERPPSLTLPAASVASPESIPVSRSAEVEVPRRPTKFDKHWPKILPPLSNIIATLFPTLYHWDEKSWWEKCLGMVAVPSVFLLTITLPVVESDKHEDDEPHSPKDASFDTQRSRSIGVAPGQSIDSLKGVNRQDMHEDIHALPGVNRHSHANSHFQPRPGLGYGQGVADVAAEQQENYEHPHHPHHHRHPHPAIAISQSDMLVSPAPLASPLPIEAPHLGEAPELWNRWLTIIQLFLAPPLCILSIYIQAPVDLSPTWLLRPILISLLISTLLLIPFLLTTTPTHRPHAYRVLLSCAGFVVSIAWISAIASQVVGALKALAVILNMSHAIMGLTIFAVGNSLGDLVADVTVARLGYPVMALSACFGGPMLNILLGIGLSGSWVLIRGAERRQKKHPGKGLRFKVYHIDMSNTLIVSGITLLVTLVGLLILVPLNRWTMSRRIGWALVALWVVSTVLNVVFEVAGWPGIED
ncbi:sodium-calcium exchanger [Teratosphaeria destructans]|uniref:Sodium-calcium exchanger n=1 Tax=Teratosphaeria destructans TaxID=418781 RepID=A0A9W7SUY8_9PEZI|nr:sodium-calcium exchanger [Teratosphaeria destructans]